MSLPFRIDESGGVAVTSDANEQLVHRVYSVLATQLGERVMIPGYGWNFQQFLWEPIDSLDQKRMVSLAKAALKTWETSAELVGMQFERTDEATIQVRVYFQTAGSNVLTSELSFGTSDDGGVFTQILASDSANITAGS